MAVEAQVLGYAEATDPSMPYVLASPEVVGDPVGTVVVAVLSVTTDPPGSPLDISALAFAYAGNNPDGTAQEGGQTGDSPNLYAYAYWFFGPDEAVSGDLGIALVKGGGETDAFKYRSQVFVFTGVESVAGAAIATGVVNGENATFAPPGALAAGSMIFTSAAGPPNLQQLQLVATGSFTAVEDGGASFSAAYATDFDPDATVGWGFNES